MYKYTQNHATVDDISVIQDDVRRYHSRAAETQRWNRVAAKLKQLLFNLHGSHGDLQCLPTGVYHNLPPRITEGGTKVSWLELVGKGEPEFLPLLGLVTYRTKQNKALQLFLFRYVFRHGTKSKNTIFLMMSLYHITVL